MRILLVTQYFWPENFKINDLCIGLQERGHSVTILTGKPNYPNGKFFPGYSFFSRRVDFYNGMKVYRTWLIPRKNGTGFNLILNYFSFAFFASIRVLFISGKFDKIFVYEPSPITVGIPAILAGKRFGAKIFFWVQDLWPESISAAGGLKNKTILRIVDYLTRYIYHHCHKILVPARSFIPYILNQKIEKEKLIYYPNSTETFYKVESPEDTYLKKLPEGIRVMFAGNIGEAQSFGTLIEAGKILNDRKVKVKWIIIGDGRMKDSTLAQVQQKGLDQSFYFLGSFPSSEMPKFFSCADALIVSLKKNPIFAMTVPSKMQSYMACGRPIIASLDGEGAAIIIEAAAGFAAPAEDAVLLANAICNFLLIDEEERKKMGLNARKYFEQEFERELLLSRLEDIFQYI